MRPIMLKMRNFGPFTDDADKPRVHTVDLSGTDSLFLISGVTGAGKTTIFDAICYSLFGSASGETRKEQFLRSEYLDSEDPEDSYTELTFSHLGTKYTVHRTLSCTYTRPRVGDKAVHPPRAVLLTHVIQDGKETTIPYTSEKSEDVTARIVRDILHMDLRHFKQISMIAQGEFRSLLTASTKERTNILRDIFMTDGYNVLTMKLKKRTSECEEKRSKLINTIGQYFCDVLVAENSVFCDEFSLLSHSAKNEKTLPGTGIMTQFIEKLTDADGKLIEECKKELAELDGKLTVLNEKKTLAEETNKKLDDLADCRKKMQELSQREPQIKELAALTERQKSALYTVKPVYDAWQEKLSQFGAARKELAAAEEKETAARDAAKNSAQALAAAEARNSEAQEKNSLHDRIHSELPRYKERETLLAEKEKLTKEKAELSGGRGKLSGQLSALEEREKALEKRTEELRDSAARLEKQKAVLTQAQKRSGTLAELLGKSFPSQKKLMREYKRAQECFEAAREEYLAKDEAYRKAQDALDCFRAGILADRLRKAPGTKCMVCGCVDYKLSELAAPPPADVSEENVKTLRDVSAEAGKLKDKAAEESGRLREKVSSGLEALKKELSQLFPEEEFSQQDFAELEALAQSRSPVLTKELSEASALADELTAQNEENAAAAKELSVLRKEKIPALSEKIKELDAELSGKTQDLVRADGRLESMGHLEFASSAEAEKAAAAAKKEADGIYGAAESARASNVQAQKALAAAEAGRKSAERSCEELGAAQERADSEFEAKMSEAGFSSAEEFLSLAVTQKKLAEEEKEINDFNELIAGTKALLEKAQSEARDLVRADTGALTAQIGELSDRQKELHEAHNGASHRLSTNEKLLANIIANSAPLEKVSEEYRLCRKLTGIVCGSSGEKGKITLEQFVQASGFDSIIDAANRRLSAMTDDRFALCRREGSLGRRSGEFLDLDVKDSFTGKKRPAGNLSGGESFKASLALAVGLSDTVSEGTGSIPADALFVDEGFGTLDKDSIDTLMTMLLSLSGGKRLVGLISHREELAECIPSQINVRRRADGKGSETMTVDNE